MATILGAQSAFRAWQETVAEATGGRVFTTHGCSWVWHPARRRLMLLFPDRPDAAGLRPGLAEGNRLGATEVSVWMNAAADASALRGFGFTDAPPILWHAGQPEASRNPWDGRVRVGDPVPEATGADAEELQVAGLPGRRVVHATARTADGVLVGRGFAQHASGGRLALHGLAVAGAERGHGIGRALVAALASSPATSENTAEDARDEGTAEDARDEGAGRERTELVLGCSPGAGGFFAACGLRLIGRGRHLLLRSPALPRG